MKHRLFLPALMCCLTLAAFGFFVFAQVYDSMWPELFAATWFDFICAIVFSALPSVIGIRESAGVCSRYGF